MKQPDLMNEWGTRFYGKAKTDGSVWWYEELTNNGTIRRIPLMPMHAVAYEQNTRR